MSFPGSHSKPRACWYSLSPAVTTTLLGTESWFPCKGLTSLALASQLSVPTHSTQLSRWPYGSDLSIQKALPRPETGMVTYSASKQAIPKPYRRTAVNIPLYCRLTVMLSVPQA